MAILRRVLRWWPFFFILHLKLGQILAVCSCIWTSCPEFFCFKYGNPRQNKNQCFVEANTLFFSLYSENFRIMLPEGSNFPPHRKKGAQSKKFKNPWFNHFSLSRPTGLFENAFIVSILFDNSSVGYTVTFINYKARGI